GTATRLGIATQPSGTVQSGIPFPQQPVIQLQDGSGNPVSQAGVAVGVRIASGGGTLGGATSATTDTAGQAVFNNLSIAGTVGPRTLRFGAAGLAGSPVTFTATGTAGPAASLAKFSGDNQVGQVGTTLATPHTVLVTDAHGNPVNNVTITWAAASGGGSVNPTSSVTDATG